jgi:DNA-binding MarR family transcriptional regulator
LATGPTIEEARALLERANVLREAADFDLLAFLARHPRTLLASESLARLLGHDLKVIARSLDSLREGGLLKRTQTSAHAARLYVFAEDATHEWLSPLLSMAATRRGRLVIREVLASRACEGRGGRDFSNVEDGKTEAGGVVLRIRSDAHGGDGSDVNDRSIRQTHGRR